MAANQTRQLGFAEVAFGTKVTSGLPDRVSQLVKCCHFELISHLREEATPGRPRWSVLVLFRAVLVHSL